LKIRKVPAAQARQKVVETLALVNLTGLGERYPSELSGGQQQRVALARSLVVEPEILLLDEPLSNLDAKLRERMRTELKVLQRRTGITFVYVTHDQSEALALSDMMAVIHGGKLQQHGTPFHVSAKPANRVVADFMGLVNLLPGTVIRARDGLATVQAAAWRLELPVPDGARAGDAVEVAIRPENIRLSAANGQAGMVPAKISERTFLGSISEYLAELDSGPVLRVQTHPLPRFALGDGVAAEATASQCSVFRRDPDKTTSADGASR